MAERRPVGFGRRGDDDPARSEPALPAGIDRLDDDAMARLLPERDDAGPQGHVRQAARDRGLARLRRRGAARLPCRGSRRRRPRDPRGARVAPAAVRRQGRRGHDDGPARGRRRGGGSRARAGQGPRPRPRRPGDRARPAAVAGHGRPPAAHPDGARGDGGPPGGPRRRGAADARLGGRVVDRRHPAMRAHAARGRVRPAARRQRPRPGRRRRPQRRRRGPRPGRIGRGDRVEPGRRAQGSAHGHRRPRRLGGRWPRSRTRRWPRAARATSWPGRSGRCSPRASPRTTPRGWASTSTARPASSVRERIGDAGLLASDLPDAVPMGRKRLAAIAERQRAGRRLGFGARTASDAADRRTTPRRPRTGRRPDGARAERAGASRRPGADAGSGADRGTARPAGLPPLARTAWLEIDLDALRGNLAALRAIVGPGVAGGAGRQGRRLRAWRGPGGARARGGRRGRPLGRDPRRGPRAARGGGHAAAAGPLPDPARRASPRPPRPAIAVSLGSRQRTGERVLARGRRPVGARLEVHLEVETGLGRGGVLPEAVAAAIARRARRRPACGWAASGRTWRPPTTPRTPAARTSGSPRPWRLVDAVAWGGGPDGRPAPPRRERRRPRRGGRALGRRAHRARHLRPGAGRARPAAGDGGRRGAPAPGHGPQGPPGPGRWSFPRVTASATARPT